MNAQPTTPATTEFITLENYSDKVWNGEIYGFSGTFLKAELEGYKALLESFLAGTTKPSKIIGTGFKNPRKYALEYLNERIAEYTKYVNREELHSITIANYFFKMSDYCVNKGVTVEQKEYFLSAYKQYKGKEFACEVKVLTPETKKPTAKVYRIFKANDRVKFAGTNEPSFFNSIESAVEKCDFDKGEKIYEYCTKYHAKLWEVCVDKNYKQITENEPTNQPKTMQATTPTPQPEPIENIKIGDIVKFTNLGDSRDVIKAKVTKIDFSEQKIYFVDIKYPKVGTCNFCFSSLQYWNVEILQPANEPTPQPETLKVGQVIQGEKCRLVVTKVADDMPQWAKEKSQKTFSANGKTWVAFGNFDILLSELSKFDSYDGMIKYVDGGYLDEKTTQNPKYEATGNGSYFTFSNDSCFVSVDLESKEISGKCYKDHNNEPRFYNQTSKGIKKALLALQNGFNENTTMFEAARLCAPFVRCRSYYAMD